MSKALQELSGASNLKDERVGHDWATWVLTCPLARRQFNNAVQYSFGCGSRGLRVSPVSFVGKCWLWGFLGLPNPFPGLFLCGFGVFRVRATVGTWLSRSACPRCPPFPPMVPRTRRARRARCARLCFLALGLSLGTVARRARSACFAGFSFRDRIRQHGGGLAPPRPEGYW